MSEAPRPPQRGGTVQAAPVPDAPPACLVLRGLPDDRAVRLAPAGLMRHPGMMMAGHAQFLPLPGESMPGPTLFVGDALPASVDTLPRVPLINTIADADLHGRSLRLAAQLLQQLGGPACLNHPLAVLATGRDAVARRLADIPGLEVPTTIRVRATRLAQLEAAMEAAGLQFPVIARLAGRQGASETILVAHRDDWEALHPLGWGGRDLYLTQFVDFRDADGLYRNVRIALIGQEIVPCLAHEQVDWLMRAPAKAGVSGSAPPGEPWASQWTARHLPALRGPLTEVARRLRLDCFAVDGCLRPDGRLLVFEANASNPTRHDLGNEAVAAALRRLLARPGAWRGRPPGV